MPRGDKNKYTDQQKRQAEKIEEGYKDKGMSEERAEGIAWATVNKIHGGGKKPGGSGHGKKPDYTRSPSEKRRTAALKGWETRRSKAKSK
ncbi:MAG: plasmid stabilization protein [Chlorobia bacterium]|nr:plasmid stabilization protein [Fimbriimonadaceae bacterium]